jgi:deoxyadenosine/deoxycytidine kinase
MSDDEFLTYEDLLDNMLEHVRPPDLLLYLDCEVDTAIERIVRRNRGKEAGIPRDYLEKLNEHYLSWYEAYDRSPKRLVPFDEFPINSPDGRARITELVRQSLEPGA